VHPFGLFCVLAADPRPNLFRTPPHSLMPFLVLARVAQVVAMSAFQGSLPDRQFGAVAVDLAPVEDSNSSPTARAQKPRTGTTVVAVSPVDSNNILPQSSKASEHGNTMLETHPVVFGEKTKLIPGLTIRHTVLRAMLEQPVAGQLAYVHLQAAFRGRLAGYSRLSSRNQLAASLNSPK